MALAGALCAIVHTITGFTNPSLHALTDEGQRVAIFYTKLHNRLLRPLLAAHDPPAPLP
jgi:hypothetical protein